MDLPSGGQTLQIVKIESASTAYSNVEFENEIVVKVERPSSEAMVEAKNDNVVWIKSEIPSNHYECFKEEPLNDVVHTKTEIQSNDIVECVAENPLDDAGSFEEESWFDDIECMKTEVQSNDFGRVQQEIPLKKEFICDVCGKVCSQKDILLTHLRTHRTHKPFQCDECGIKFTLKYYLIRHQRNHDESARRFRCDECGRGFFVKNNLETHKLTHAGIKPFACDECDSRFSRKNALNIHKLTHSSDPSDIIKAFPYVCDLCKKQFKRKAYLERHRRIYSGDRPYACKDCGKGYSQSAHLNEHKVLIHSSVEEREKLMLPCSICNKKFLRPYNLKLHLKRVCNKAAK